MVLGIGGVVVAEMNGIGKENRQPAPEHEYYADPTADSDGILTFLLHQTRTLKAPIPLIL
jgi:hypothetical protein